MNKGLFKNSNINYSLILLIISMLSILGLYIIDKSNIYNYIFAVVFLIVIYIFFNESLKKMLYYSTLLFAIMGETLGVHLQKYLGIDERINLYYIFLLIYMIKFIIDLFKNSKTESENFKFDYINILFIVFGIYTFGSFILAGDKKVAIIKLLYYAVMFSLVIMIIRENKTKKELIRTLEFLGVLSIGILLLGLFKIISGIQIEPNSVYLNTFKISMAEMWRPYNRIPTLFFYNPNNFSVVAVLILMSFSILFVTKNRYNKIGIFFVLLLAEVNIIFARSRTAWIASIVVLIFSAIVLLIKKRFINATLLIIPIILFFLIFRGLEYMKSMDFLFEKMGEIHKVVDDDGNVVEENNIELGSNGSINVRATLYTDILNSFFKDKNILGLGPGNINIYIRELDNTHGRYDPHCWWLEILGDFGVVGFLSFTLGYFLMALRFFLRFLSQKSMQDISLFGLTMLAATFLMVFAPSSVFRFVPFWVTIAITLSISNIIAVDNESKIK